MVLEGVSLIYRTTVGPDFCQPGILPSQQSVQRQERNEWMANEDGDECAKLILIKESVRSNKQLTVRMPPKNEISYCVEKFGKGTDREF